MSSHPTKYLAVSLFSLEVKHIFVLLSKVWNKVLNNFFLPDFVLKKIDYVILAIIRPTKHYIDFTDRFVLYF